ncbi:MAG: TolC family protein [Blastocatellia bacterium]|nr:TolC family protein [Blastocatellia bacterium]
MALLVPASVWAQIVQVSPPTPSAQTGPPTVPSPLPHLSREEAVRLALQQASGFQQAQLAEAAAAEDVKQAKAGFLPKVTHSSSYIYTSPAVGNPPDAPRAPSYIAANSIHEFVGFVGAAGELDVAGRLRTTLKRNRALLAAAGAGTEAARRDLVRATEEAYYTLALAVGNRRLAEQNLEAAEAFERITDLLVKGGEAAPVDLVRAGLQTASRRSEVETARANETGAADGLRILVGFDFGVSFEVGNILEMIPITGELDRFTADLIEQRPELKQLEAERQAAERDIRLARAERLPQLTYFINGGFDAASLHADLLGPASGASATFSLTIPLFDWGVSKSHEQQARLRAKALESAKTVALKAFAQQFYAALAQARSAGKRIGWGVTGVTDAERNVATSIARYRAGEGSILEVTDAQTTLVTQRTALYQAIFDYQTARARLAQTAGN